MNRYCLDTSAYSQFQRGQEEVVRLVDAAAWVGLPSVVLGELWTGFLQGGHPDRNESELAAFLANDVVEEITANHSVSRHYAEILVALRARGTPLPTNDIWVAACAAQTGATVLTFDDHFAAIERVGSLILEA